MEMHHILVGIRRMIGHAAHIGVSLYWAVLSQKKQESRIYVFSLEKLRVVASYF